MRDQREITVAGEARSARPMPGSAPRRPRSTGAGPGEFRAAFYAVAGGIGRLCLRRPGEVLGSVAALGAVAIVSLNALGYQAGRHPAPIFSKPAARADAKPEAKAAASKPVQAKVSAPEREAREPKAADGGHAEAARAKADPTPQPRDALGDIIRAASETTASVTPKADKSVIQVQRALIKLGYGPLKADGVMGTGTRAAIEKFERDRKLPVKGEASGRTLRELAARAGLPPG